MDFETLKFQTFFNKNKDSGRRKMEGNSRSQLANNSQVPSEIEDEKLYLEPTTPENLGRK